MFCTFHVARSFLQAIFHCMSNYIKSRNSNEKYVSNGHIVLGTFKRYHAHVMVLGIISGCDVSRPAETSGEGTNTCP